MIMSLECQISNKKADLLISRKKNLKEKNLIGCINDLWNFYNERRNALIFGYFENISAGGNLNARGAPLRPEMMNC